MHRKYIPIYIQQDATIHILFISGNCSTCFGWYFHPSSGAHTTVSTASVICHTVTATRLWQVAVTVWQIPDDADTVVCAPDDGWRYHPKYVEQFPDINKLCIVASYWIYVCWDCVLSGTGLCDELISRPDESYWLWWVVVCDLETSRMRRPWPALGRSVTAKKNIYIYIYIYIYTHTTCYTILKIYILMHSVFMNPLQLS